MSAASQDDRDIIEAAAGACLACVRLLESIIVSRQMDLLPFALKAMSAVAEHEATIRARIVETEAMLAEVQPAAPSREEIDCVSAAARARRIGP